YTILHSTQFFELVDGMINADADGDVIRLSPALVEPCASDDVATALANLAVGPPVNGIVEVAGPEQFPLDQLASIARAAKHDQRRVIADIHARYYGALLDD